MNPDPRKACYRQKSRRSARGSTLGLMLALSIAIGWVLLYFGWQYTKQLGSYEEQKTAIDAASDAAAKDLSRIVVEDPIVGFISLSDYAPVGKTGYTQASDGFAVHVQGINTLLATARVDMILADYMNDPIMQQLAAVDYKNAINAQTRLANVLRELIPAGGTNNPVGTVGYDINGSIVNPVQDALNAYTSNEIRMAGRPSLLVPGSLKLTLGFVPGAQSSRALLPKPTSAANVPANQQVNGYYLPNTQVYYKGQYPTVFAALGADTTLVDFKKFQTDIGLSAAVPTVVKVEANQKYYDTDAYGKPMESIIHTASAAQASCILDQRPYPGAFTVTLTTGTINSLNTFADLFTNTQLLSAPTDALQGPTTGDFPETNLSAFNFLNNNVFQAGIDLYHPQFTCLLSVAFYDWIRRMGMNVNIGQITGTLMGTSMVPASSSSPTVLWFSIDSNGNLVTNQTTAANINLGVSQNQWRADSGLALYDGNGYGYDVQLTDNCYVEGRPGGQHWGEPLDNPGTLGGNNFGLPAGSPAYFENTALPYQEFLFGPASNTVRPTYSNNGIACDITFRRRLVWPTTSTSTTATTSPTSPQ